jgi:hypothetical protein
MGANGETEGDSVRCTSFRPSAGSLAVPEEVADFSPEVLFDFVSKELTAVEDFMEPHTQATDHSSVLHLVTIRPNHLGRDEKEPPLGGLDGHAEYMPRSRLLGAPDESAAKAEVLGFAVDEGVGR